MDAELVRGSASAKDAAPPVPDSGAAPPREGPPEERAQAACVEVPHNCHPKRLELSKSLRGVWRLRDNATGELRELPADEFPRDCTVNIRYDVRPFPDCQGFGYLNSRSPGGQRLAKISAKELLATSLWKIGEAL